MEISAALKAQLVAHHRNGITEPHIYRRLVETIQAPEKARVVRETAADELRRHSHWKVYTGTAYILTVLVLVLTCLLFQNYFLSLAFTLAMAIAIIALFAYHIGVALDEPFRRRFLEMAGSSLGVAALSFGVGFLVHAVLGVDV